MKPVCLMQKAGHCKAMTDHNLEVRVPPKAFLQKAGQAEQLDWTLFKCDL